MKAIFKSIAFIKRTSTRKSTCSSTKDKRTNKDRFAVESGFGLDF